MCTLYSIVSVYAEDNVYVLLCRAVSRCRVPLLFVLLSEDDG